MISVNRDTRSGGLRWGLAFVAAAGLAACTGYSRPAEPIAATKPTITYAYNDDQGLVDATRKAETYCAQYSAWPRTTDIYTRPEGGRNVTFVCDQPRNGAITSSSMGTVPRQRTVSYTYRDDRGLVEATSMAHRYCAGFDAQARSTLVTTNPDASKTISFECVRTL